MYRWNGLYGNTFTSAKEKMASIILCVETLPKVVDVDLCEPSRQVHLDTKVLLTYRFESNSWLTQSSTIEWKTSSKHFLDSPLLTSNIIYYVVLVCDEELM